HRAVAVARGPGAGRHLVAARAGVLLARDAGGEAAGRALGREVGRGAGQAPARPGAAAVPRAGVLAVGARAADVGAAGELAHAVRAGGSGTRRLLGAVP